MANRKISEFTALTAPAASDVLAIIDQSESGADKNKKITFEDLLTNAPAGTQSAPSFSFIGDNDTGLAQSGADGLLLTTGGTARLTINSAGLVTIPGDLTVSGTTTTIDTTTLTIKDKNIEVAKGLGNDAAVDGAGITIDSTDGDKTFNWVDSTDAWTSSEHIDLASGKVLKVAGTQVLSATQYTGNAATATTATTGTNITVADESSDTSCNVLFTTAATGSLPPKTGTNLTFNSSSGVLTATGFAGALTGNVTGNCSGTAATVTGATQSNITALGTLASLASGAITTTDNLSIDNAKELRLYEADSNGSAYIGIKGATDKGSEASYTVSLPAAAPTANQILKANASTPTSLEWATDTATDSSKMPLAGGTFTGSVIHNYTDAIKVPVGTTGQRPTGAAGHFRYNSTTGKFEGYTDEWGEIAGGGGGDAGLLQMAQTVATSITLTTNYNAFSVQPTIASGVTVTVPAGAVWAVI